ncbi:hypothetical protein CSV86_013500 [Pseudomonas putida CSV86]|uniref:Uncharacterized protein n=1 Tax=Pseudomonas bharatica CSV86 TaxID=1005395 RepID=A0A7K4EEV7_9PSED|nr:hypothetical protein [Pseudomonas bharatica]NNJ16167.1 hypothetical protein [Pseudomonas bharatica CSV86]
MAGGSTPRPVAVEQPRSVDNRGGEISSQLAFLLAAAALDNGSGKLLSEQGLTLRIARCWTTPGAGLAPRLDIRAGSLVNPSGSLSSSGAIDLLVDGALDNQGGKLLADSAAIRVGSLDNRLGLVQSDTRLAITSVGGVDNARAPCSPGRASSSAPPAWTTLAAASMAWPISPSI